MIGTTKRKLARIGAAMTAVTMVAAVFAMNAMPVSAGVLTQTKASLTSAAASTATSAKVEFRVTTTGTIATVDVALPDFSGASPTVSGVIGLGAGTIASSGAAGTYKVTYSVTAPASVTATTDVSFTVGGLTNPGATGVKIVTITTKTSVPATIDSGSTLVTITTNAATSVTAVVTQAIVGSISGGGSYTLTVDPSGTAETKTTAYTVAIASNAKNGVTTKVNISGPLTGVAYSADTIATVAGTFGAPTAGSGGFPPVNTWGITNNDGTSWAGPTTAGLDVTGLTTGGPTNSINESHKIGLKVDFTTPADTYTTTVNYIFTPKF